MAIYKISCEYYVKADDEGAVLEGIGCELDEFPERHLAIEQVENIEEDDIYADYRDYSK